MSVSFSSTGLTAATNGPTGHLWLWLHTCRPLAPVTTVTGGTVSRGQTKTDPDRSRRPQTTTEMNREVDLLHTSVVVGQNVYLPDYDLSDLPDETTASTRPVSTASGSSRP